MEEESTRLTNWIWRPIVLGKRVDGLGQTYSYEERECSFVPNSPQCVTSPLSSPSGSTLKLSDVLDDEVLAIELLSRSKAICESGSRAEVIPGGGLVDVPSGN